MIGDDGTKAIAASLSGSSLTELDLRNNKVGDEGVKAIAAALHGSSLAEIALNKNEIGDEGAKAIAAVLPGSKLTGLALYRCVFNPFLFLRAYAVCNFRRPISPHHRPRTKPRSSSLSGARSANALHGWPIGL